VGRQSVPVRKAEALWSQFGPAVSRMLLSYERDAHLRQDLAQEVFLAVLDSADRIQAADNPRAYLFRIVHNVATDHVASESRRRWVQLDECLVDPRHDPAQEAHATGEADRLLLAVQSLRLPYRQVLVLFLEDLDHAEIAEILGIPAGTVRVRLLRARDQLKELLGHE
jgi:RNA polymerase sigma-70 factor (ECF subfamily)